MKKTSAAALFFLVSGLGAASWAYHSGHRQQMAVLSKITALESRLSTNNKQATKSNAFIVHEIGRIVSYNRNMRRDVEVLTESKEIVRRTQALTDTLHTLQRQLRAEAGENAAGPLHHPEASVANSAGSTTRLVRHLSGYSAFIRTYVPDAVTFGPNEPQTALLPAGRSPLAVALASLTSLEALIRQEAAYALHKQAQKVGTNCICFDKIGAMAVATANTVAPGAVYEARLFLTQSASSYYPKMSANGRPIPLQPDGQGMVEFRVPAGQPRQPDTVRAQWQGIIKAQGYLGDTTWQLNVPYYIVKQPAR